MEPFDPVRSSHEPPKQQTSQAYQAWPGDGMDYEPSKYGNSRGQGQQPPSAASQRYSPMNPNTLSSTNYQPMNTSSYQHRQSPSRSHSDYAQSQSYYSQNTPAVRGATTSAQPGLSPYPPHSSSGRPPSISNLTLQPPHDGSPANRYYTPNSSNPSAAPILSMFENPQPAPQRQSPPRDTVPRLVKLNNISELQPHRNSQPAYRRANPEGGFISPLQALTSYLPTTYRICQPTFKYESSRNPRRVLTKPSKGVKNDGYDNEDSDYILYVNDILGSEEGGHKNRYLILDVLGQGTFGQVVKCQNTKTQEVVAVKVVKNRTAYFNQSMMEVSVLELLNSKLDKNDDHHILRLKDTFIHRQHLCLVFELLSVNLYELIKQNQFRGLSTTLVRVFAQQLLNALTLLNKAKLIHCDLKPENILLKNLESPVIKVIDFGSACDERQTVYTYIQSRFYRSPEVLLGLPYSSAIDMWSLGCIVVELFLGLPLFPGSSEYNQVARIHEMLGQPPVWMLEMGKQATDFYEKIPDEFGRKNYALKSMEKYAREHDTKEQPSKKYFQATTLPDIIQQYSMPRKNMKPQEIEREMSNRVAFIDFVRGLLNINPLERWSPAQARLHPFITQQKFTAPFVPPMNLKSSSSKSPAPGVQQQQQAQEVVRQRQAQQAHAQMQQAQGHMQPQPPYPGMPVANYHPAAQPHPQAPPIYNNVYQGAPHQQQHHQQPIQPPPYSAGPSGGYPPQQMPPMQHGPPASQQVHPGGYGIHQPPYPTAANARSGRPRASTIGQNDGIPSQLQRAASMMDPNAPIRLQPSPAYYPPPPGPPDDYSASSRSRRRSQGGQGGHRGNRDLIGRLEERTLEDGSHWA